MNPKYRDLQVRTSVLVFIILGILILGTVIFFLGVQVGKKQAELMSQTLLSQKTEEKVTPLVPVMPQEQSAPSRQENKQESTTETVSSEPTVNQIQIESQKQPAEKPAESSTPSTTSKVSSTSEEARTVSQTTSSASPKSSPPPAAPATKSSAGRYYIQVGAFNDRASARLAAERYKKQGYNAVVKEPFPKDKKPLYRVWLGAYQSKEEAQKVLNDLIKRSVRNPGYFIVQQ